MKFKILATGEEHREAILNLLRGDNRRIRMVFLHVYDVELVRGGVKLKRLLLRQLAADTKLTLIIGEIPKDEKKREEVDDFLQELEEHGARIHVNPNVHAKVMLAEGRDGRYQVLISSANLSETALYYNYELGVEIDEAEKSLYMKVADFINGILGSKTKGVKEYVV